MSMEQLAVAYDTADKDALGYNLFWQDTRVSEFHSFVASREGESVQVVSANDAMGGVCFGFCMTLLMHQFNYDEFLNFIATNEGRGVVRGFQFMQSLVFGVESMPDFKSKAKTLDTGYHLIQRILRPKYSVRINDVFNTGRNLFQKKKSVPYQGILETGKKLHARNILESSDPMDLFYFMQSRQGYFFQLGIYGESCGHALCMAYTKKFIAVFDPNLGIFLFDGSTKDALVKFVRFMGTLIFQGYAGVHDKAFSVLALKPNFNLDEVFEGMELESIEL